MIAQDAVFVNNTLCGPDWFCLLETPVSYSDACFLSGLFQAIWSCKTIVASKHGGWFVFVDHAEIARRVQS